MASNKKKRYKPSNPNKPKGQVSDQKPKAQKPTPPKGKQTPPPKESNVLQKPQNPWLFALLVAVATLVTYWAAFDNQLTNWDDNYYVNDNPVLQTLDGETVKEIFFSDDPEIRYHMGNYHPLTMLSLNFDYQLGGKDREGEIKSWPYITNNVILHILNAVLIFYLIFLLWGRVDIATIAALLFGVHAIHVESVAWISERKDVLYTFFYLLSLIAYLKYLAKERYSWIGVSFVLFVLSLLSKGQAVTLAPSLILIDWLKGRKLLSIKVVLEKIPFFILAFTFGIIAIIAQEHGQAIHRISEYPFYMRILFACFGFSQYLFKLVAPAQLAAIYPYPILMDMKPNASLWLHLLSTVGFLGIGVWAYLKQYRNMAFGLAFFIVNIFLLLQLIPVGSAIMADRYSYIPSIGIHAIFAFLFVALYEKMKLPKSVVYAGVAIYGIVLGVLSHKQINTWQDSMSLWSQTLKVSPKSVVAWNNRGSLKEKLAKDGEEVKDPNLMQSAIFDFNEALKIKPDYTTALYNRGVAFHDLKQYPQALADFNLALKHDPTFGDAYHNRGLVKDKTGKFKEAIEDFNKALQFKPSEQKVYVNRGVSKGKLGRLNEAIEDFNTAIKMTPDKPSPYSNRGLANDKLGNYEQALKDYNMAISLDKDFVTAYANRGLVYQKLEKWNESIADFNKAIELSPNVASHYFSRARSSLKIERYDLVCNDLLMAKKLGIQNLDDDIQRFCNMAKQQ